MRLIDADALMEDIRKNSQSYFADDFAHEWVDSQPTIKPKTGHLHLLNECANAGYYCSECHKKVIKEGWSKTVKKIKFCPNCGTKMGYKDETNRPDRD